ncbi:MAG TPA: diaminopimelate epimerase [Anaeromyxobacteraceae bacterium]
MALTFWKYQGLGNDFVVVETPELMTAEAAVRLCHRRRGIGADGVLSVLPPRAGGAAYMHIYNSDGSVAAMCGNGIRCVARHLAERRGLAGDLVVETDAGPKRCVVHRSPSGHVDAVSVEMGPARWVGEETFEVGGERLVAHRVSMGNPHAVFFGEASRARATALGPLVERAVEGGVNAGFAAVRAGGLDLVVWERGAGLTDACGTGACAAAVAAVKAGRLPAGTPLEVRLPGGPLVITVAPDLTGVLMRGPAERAFEGRTELAA